MRSTTSSVAISTSLHASLSLPWGKACAALLMGLAAGVAGWLVVPGPAAWASLPLALGLAWACAIDIDRFILPDAITLALVVVGLLLHASLGSVALLDAAIGATAGYSVLAGLAYLYERFRGRPGLGLGDAKLLAAAGAWLGWKALPFVVLAGSLGALAFVLSLAALRGRTVLARPLPFGPFLAGAFFTGQLVQPWPFG